MTFSFASAHLSSHLGDENSVVEDLLSAVSWDEARATRVETLTGVLVDRIRGQKTSLSEIETFLQYYPLSSPQGLALMTLAEALLRIPDADTADKLIAEKLRSADWSGSGGDILMKSAGLGLSLAKKALGSSFFGSLGKPVIRKSLSEAVRRLGQQFVLGQTIQEALKNAQSQEKAGYRFSFDMLGEGARTRQDAANYFEAYKNAAHVIGQHGNQNLPIHKRSGLSIKLSALHPRYVWNREEVCVPEITAMLLEICEICASANIPLTIDAEESDRLELSLKILGKISAHPGLIGWNGLGLAVQAYDKRCFKLIDDLYGMAVDHNRHLAVRLVKGAYWDTEIKRAQVAGLSDYPLFTRKANTDLSYLACAQKLLNGRDRFYPMFATHNAQSVAAILDFAHEFKTDNRNGFEFQRLHGMGASLHDHLLHEKISPVCIYAPVGSYEDLLPYLVRRMLENGANTSFVSQIRGKKNGYKDLAEDPVRKVSTRENKRHAQIPLPEDIFNASRKNARGVDLSSETMRSDFTRNFSVPRTAVTSAIANAPNLKSGSAYSAKNPANINDVVSDIWEAVPSQIAEAFDAAQNGYKIWSAIRANERAACLRRLADLLEKNYATLIPVLQKEAGRTLPDSIGEWREAIDFCRYYASEGEALFNENGQALPGPTGESNRLFLTGRGIFICISPWNFPLSIFVGQIVAALMAGNAVIAKPAEQTPLIAYQVVKLMREAGIPGEAVSLILGDGRIGSALVNHKLTAGVAFTGSTDVAHSINRALAAKDGPIVPLIAETGGQNAMIVDSSALLEQVIDDCIASAFGSAGQRCSALRVVCIQAEIYTRFCELLKGAVAELKLGNPQDIATDIGPVIDAAAFKKLQDYKHEIGAYGRKLAEAPLPADLNGYFFAPIVYEIDSLKRLTREIFGPVLHIIKYKANDKDKIIEQINATGYGLTFGLHSRLETEFEDTAQKIQAGNIYINRSMIGAQVGVQPFGGTGLSGTGPKAGGPYYLHRFATEKTVSINTTATGGNLALIGLED